MQTYLEIFLIGLLGSMHCIGMCGGFVAMYSLKKPSTLPTLPSHVLYNLGRITTYSLLGGILGYIGSFVTYVGEHRGIPGAVLLISGAFMVLMGLNIAGVLGKRGLFEETGITMTSAFRNALHRVLALKSVWSTYLLGLLLGFLPCGLLYPIFMNAAASGGFISGTLIMAVFGFSTVPAMMSFGLLIKRLQPHIKLAFYRAASVLIVLLGLRTFLRGMAFNGWIPMGRFW
jgi:sulfite exporter TauE/SafE